MTRTYTIIVERHDKYDVSSDNDELFQYALDDFKENMSKYAKSCKITEDVGCEKNEY